MKKITLCRLLLICFIGTVIVSCNKYKDIVDARLSGDVFVHDTLSTPIVSPLSKMPVYFNTGNDTSKFLVQAITDSLGHFSLVYFDKKEGVLFTNFIRNKVKYSGVINIPKSGDGTMNVRLDVYPVYKNGLSLTFSSKGGPISNYPFRLYTSRTAAVVDSVKFAYLNSTSNVYGLFRQYNLNAGKYYISAKDSVTGTKIKLLDSVTIANSGFVIKTVTVF
ncbi:hypothetical protein [Pedobacter nutrimenti]|uniref:hypothetical protein n=1 Tax=Pedobacter nutrimenti TaxID=1241337 RepID=UPI0029318352|nr:hypothetical protein [Pedobacter nutrimenti]